MSVEISYKDKLSWMVSNARGENLISFAIEVGNETAKSNEQIDFVSRLQSYKEELVYTYAINLETLFPSVEEKKFWARIFSNVARRIFLRKMGNQNADYWQDSFIGDAHIIRRVLANAVTEMGNQWWWPEDENSVAQAAEHEAATRERESIKRLMG